MTRKRGLWGWRIAAIILFIVQVPVLVGPAADPEQSDFVNYFTPAYVLSRGGEVGALYDRDGFDRALEQTGIHRLGSFVPHPPANALWLLPFAFQPPQTAKALWSTALVLSIAFTIWSVMRIGPGFPTPVAVVLVLAPALAIRNGLAFGQPYLILGAWLAFGLLALQRGHAFVAGVLLGLGVSFKPYALGLLVLFLRRDRRRSLFGFALGALAPSALLWALTGREPFLEFGSKVLPWMLRGDIQDPFSPGWGSVSSLTNRLLRYEPDLNPSPWFAAPLLARFVGASVPAFLLALGVMAGRRALDSNKPADAVGAVIAAALAASPFVASYHLVLFTVPALAVATRLRGRALVLWMIGWAVLGSSFVHVFRSAAGAFAPLAWARLFVVLSLFMIVVWPFLNRRMAAAALLAGALAGVFALGGGGIEDSWERIEAAKGYSMMRPHFCGGNLRWWSPSADGRRLETRGGGEDCIESPRRPSDTAPSRARASNGPTAIAVFEEGSWNIHLRNAAPSAVDTRLTRSQANEIDPVIAPDGCSVVFASDQGRGLGSTALYRIRLVGLIEGCEAAGPALAPR